MRLLIDGRPARRRRPRPPPAGRCRGALAALASDHRDAERFAAIVGEDAIGARVDELACALVADLDAPGRVERIARALEGRRAALGPGGPLAAGRAQLGARRRAACALAGAGRAATRPAALRRAKSSARSRCTPTPSCSSELAAERLAPLADLTPAARERLRGTLLAWLRHQAQVAPAASELHVHPQTVRYRLARLRERLGAILDDPDARFELELALRARTRPSPADRGSSAPR